MMQSNHDIRKLIVNMVDKYFTIRQYYHDETNNLYYVYCINYILTNYTTWYECKFDDITTLSDYINILINECLSTRLSDVKLYKITQRNLKLQKIKAKI
jgi:hypothetical protein